MTEQTPRPVRKVGIPDHLWDTFEQMAQEMGSDRDGLINQALFMFARLNGFLVPGVVGPGRAVSDGEDDVALDEFAVDRTPQSPSISVGRRSTTGVRASVSEPVPSEPPMLTPKLRRDESGVRHGGGGRGAADGGFDSDPAPPQPMDHDPARMAVAQRVLETAAELENLIKGKQNAGELMPEVSTPNEAIAEPPESSQRELVIIMEGRDDEPIVKDRYLIGRGKHCDLVINSGKVSREHAAIVREGSSYFVQDLDSSNGTWFNKQRIKKQKIEDGDEFFICSDKVKFLFR